MNIYRKLSLLLKDASTFEFEDKVVQTASRIAQIQGDVRVNSEITGMLAALQQENALLKQQYTKLYLENQQLKGAVLESPSMPSGIKVTDSPNEAGKLNVQVGPSQAVMLNTQQSTKGTMNDIGFTLNSQEN